ncbi:MAG TPA: hypothetical protein VLA60_12900, partial [Nitrospirales bacterium]|nr:hypothetical protein [Nitrospirales bacterium]
KILGEGDGPATHGEPEYKAECREKFMHVLYLTKLGVEYQAGPGCLLCRNRPEADLPSRFLQVKSHHVHRE